MPEWAKVLIGSLALIIGASAPSGIIFVLNPSLFVPPQLSPSTPPVGEVPSGVTKPQSNERYEKQNDHESFWEAALRDPVALGTLALAVATTGLAFVTWEAAKDTRRALILAQRPRLRVRNVVVHTPRHTFYVGTIFHPNELVVGQLYIVNVGGTEARLVEAHCEVYWTTPGVDTLPMERPYEGRDVPAIRVILQPGQSAPLPFGSDRLIGGRESNQILDGQLMIYVLGLVAYSDQLGIIRRTAFCRKYDHRRGRFFAVDDPDYEHEE
jgi:hypothetical protein